MRTRDGVGEWVLAPACAGEVRKTRYQATARQPGLNSHLNASEVALTAITLDGRLLTRAPASLPASSPGRTYTSTTTTSPTRERGRDTPPLQILKPMLKRIERERESAPLLSIPTKCRDGGRERERRCLFSQKWPSFHIEIFLSSRPSNLILRSIDRRAVSPYSWLSRRQRSCYFHRAYRTLLLN